MGSVAPVVMSLVVFSGAAQFAALTVLTAGGGAVAAIAAGMLMNARWLPMGLAVGPFLTRRPRCGASRSRMALVDASFALSSRGDGTYDRGVLIGATLPQWLRLGRPGRCVGVLGGALLARPAGARPGRDVPGLLPVLLAGEARGRAAAHRGRARRGDRARADAVRAARRAGARRRGRAVGLRGAAPAAAATASRRRAA